jgi:hypothetical protein
MTDIISVAGKEYTLSPMDIWESTELLFVLKPYSHLFDEEVDVYEFVKKLMIEAQDKGPIDPFRALALMYHVDADNFIDTRTTGEELVFALRDGLIFHEVKTLMEYGELLGIIEGEKDGAS